MSSDVGMHLLASIATNSSFKFSSSKITGLYTFLERLALTLSLEHCRPDHCRYEPVSADL
jgi:hypothetical protein